MRTVRFAILSSLWIVSGVAFARAQTNSDRCHVYVVDVEAARRFTERANMDELAKMSKEEQEKAAQKAGVGNTFDDFQTKVGEEELTTRSYPWLKTGLIITASVFYTDESLASTGHSNSMLLAISVANKATDNALFARDAVIAEVTYDENTDVVRVKRNILQSSRMYLVGLECRCKEAGAKEKK